LSDEPTALESLALELLAVSSETGREQALADHVERWALAQPLHEVVRAGCNLALQPRPWRPATPRVLLLGHLDTVPAAGGNPVRVEGDRIHGLGASDMKCADALILHLVAQAARRDPAVDLAAVLYAREEGPYADSGLPEIVEATEPLFRQVDLAVALEPTDNAFELGCLGTLHARVRFRGRRAHSARPWEGRNAIHMAGPLLAALESLEPRDCEADGLLFREVCSATMVSFEGARNVVPGAFEVNLNFRFAPDRTRPEALAWVAELVRGAVGEAPIEAGDVTIAITDFCPSGRVCTDNPLFGGLRACAPDAAIRAKQAWTDVGRLSEMGVDAINFGPGSGAEAHQAGESCSRAQLEAARAILEGWLFP
jgi:succinyl-diaminopimelate desuccinylase